jgi:hypothetical protein
MTAILTSVAQVRLSVATMVQMACGTLCTTVHVIGPRRPGGPYTVEIPIQYRRAVYKFLAQHIQFTQLPDDAELLALTDQQAAHVVRLSCEAAEKAAAEE